MLTAREEYSLRRFDAKSVKTSAFDKAIRIYFDTTGGGVKTDATQIVYWAERRDTEFSHNGDQVHVLGLLRDREIVGFALAFYLPERRLFVVDHIAITPMARSMTSFEKFCELIARHAIRESTYIDYFVAEVSDDINDSDPVLNAETLIRLLQIVGCRVAECTYLTPSAGISPPYRPVKAKLLLHTTTETRILGENLLEIVSAMHDGLYKNWYRPFSRDFEKYCAHLREIQQLIKREMGNKEYIALSGHASLRGEAAINDLPQRQIVITFYSILAAVLAVGVAAAVSWLGIGIYSIVGGAIAAAICIIVVMAVWYDNAAKLVRYGINAVIGIFGK